MRAFVGQILQGVKTLRYVMGLSGPKTKIPIVCLGTPMWFGNSAWVSVIIIVVSPINPSGCKQSESIAAGQDNRCIWEAA